MKCLLLFIVLLLVGCGSGGGTTETSVIDNTDPVTPPPTCKSIFNVWQSNSDFERHDFTGRQFGVSLFYQYLAFNNVTCGGLSGSLNEANLEIFLNADGSVSKNAGFQGIWYVRYDVASLGGHCDANWSAGATKARMAHWKIECDTLTMCSLYEGVSPYDCKVFH